MSSVSGVFGQHRILRSRICCSRREAIAAALSNRRDGSVGSVGLARTTQPSAYGASFRSRGRSATAVFRSRIVASTGSRTAPVYRTLSTVATLRPRASGVSTGRNVSCTNRPANAESVPRTPRSAVPVPGSSFHQTSFSRS